MFTVGDRVQVSAHRQEAVTATVVLASPNGRSLILEFPGGLFRAVSGGVYVGSMPVLQNLDGTWSELINGTAITIEADAQRGTDGA